MHDRLLSAFLCGQFTYPLRMPGQRAKNKVPFGGYIDNKLHRKIIAAADKAGWRHNRFGFFLDLLTPIVERRYRRLQTGPKPRQPARSRPAPASKSRSAKSKKRV
jgi:hypothetical protein